MALYQQRLYLLSGLEKALATLKLSCNGQKINGLHERQLSRLVLDRRQQFVRSVSVNECFRRPSQLKRPLNRSPCRYEYGMQCYNQPSRHLSQLSQDHYVYSPRPPIVVPEISLGEFIMDKLEKYGSLEAMVDIPTRRRWTFKELRDDVVRVSSGLAKLGLGKGDVVCVFAGNCPEYVILLVAVMNIGAVLSPVNPASTSAELSRALSLAEPRAVVADANISETADQACNGLNFIKEKISVGSADGWLPFSHLLEDDGLSFTKPVAVNPKEDIALLPFSSGTTGLPKGVMLTHRNVLANMIQFSQATPAITGHDRVLAYLPFYHAYGLNGKILYCLYNGTSLNIIPKFADNLLDILCQEKITIFHLVPPICLFVLKHPNLKQYDLSWMRLAICAAAPIGKAQVDQFIEYTGIKEFAQGYGMTEVAPVASMDVHPIRSGSVGQPLSSTIMKVVDLETGEALRQGQTGEICIRGPQVMAGYLRNPEATAATLQDNWLMSGDVGHYDSDGYFYITDRVKELIKYKANQVAPAELEALLITHPAIQDAAVIGVPDEEAGELPRAYIVTKPGISPDLTEKEVMDFVSERVSPYKKLRGGVEFVGEIPKSPSGKILRRLIKPPQRIP